MKWFDGRWLVNHELQVHQGVFMGISPCIPLARAVLLRRLEVENI